ncbi:MAG TPA: metallophosphoesterase [Ignavibacteria bacterium]|nr:metallophosphoesterase [Ignavibacteria bacterium]
MKKIFHPLLLILLFFISSFAQEIRENKFLTFSDIHFDPYYDTTLVSELIKKDFNEWEKVFSGSQIQKINGYGKDSNFPLFRSAMTEMKQRIPDPDFIVITGDFMSHDFNENYKKYSGIEDTDSLNQFIKKTIQFVTSYIVKFYPATLIFPMVGNDDAYCGNYMIEPESNFLKLLSEEWAPLVNGNHPWEFQVNGEGINRSFSKDFLKGGYCLLNFPEKNNFRMIILNTVFFATNYVNQCGDTLQDPGEEELLWLRNTLKQCRDSGNKVWLSYHIPPGIDIYGTINGKGDCEEKIFSTWKEKYNKEFLNIVKEYSETILAQFAGHFHRDDFRIIYDKERPVSYIHITPSVSPIYGNNPSYQIIEYDKKNFELLNYQTYFLNDNSDTDSSHWKFEYDFKTGYKQPSVSPEAYDNISKLIFADSTYREKYVGYYRSGDMETFNRDYKNWLYNWCGFGHLTVEEYFQCMCQDKYK